MATGTGDRVSAASPFAEEVEEILGAISALDGGTVADYIPELGKADPSWFGIAVATIDGAVHEAGDSRLPFTIQSISKPFVYGLALEDQGRAEVMRRVGVEPTGDAFNSIEIDESSRRPYNPMVNAGAIVTSGMVRGDDAAERRERVMGFLSEFAGRPLDLDEDVFRSESDTGDRNRAIAYFMRAHGMLDDVDDVLDLYFRQCSVLVSCRDLAVMAATLANGGLNPLTGRHALHRTHVESVLSVMATCGMYDYAGEWLYTVGLPAKSGVAGGVIAVLPGQLGIGVFSPPLDARGNSVRGIAVCQELSRRYQLHQYRPGLLSTNAVRRRYRGDVVRGRRTRTPEEIATLDREGRRIGVYELRGELSFGPTERLMRAVLGELGELDHVILDMRRTTAVDEVSAGMLERLSAVVAERGARFIIAHVEEGRFAAESAADLDEALLRCEQDLLAEALGPRDHLVVELADQPLLAGLSQEQVAALDVLAERRVLQRGDVLCHEGEDSGEIWFIRAGTLRVQMDLPDGALKRLLTMGPGAAVGEIALLDGGPRSATVTAESDAEVIGLSLEALERAGAEHPGLTATLYRNLGRLLAWRLRRTTEQVRSLEQ